MNTGSEIVKPKFALQIIKPFSTFSEGVPAPIPYCINGLLTEGGFSVLGAKPKSGKSSFSRSEAVAVSKGEPFLERETVRGGTLLVTMEDPRNHVDNCLQALGWNPETDAEIHIVEQLSPSIDESIEAIGDTLTLLPNVRLVIVDTLAKLLRSNDLNDYSKTLPMIEKVHDLARNFPHVHIQGLVHCKKVRADDPFDSLLGSTALRREPDSNIVIYKDRGKHVIVTETRVGRSIDHTILEAELTDIAGADVVKSFSLGEGYDAWSENKAEKREKREAINFFRHVVLLIRRLMREMTQKWNISCGISGLWPMSGRRAKQMAPSTAAKKSATERKVQCTARISGLRFQLANVPSASLRCQRKPRFHSGTTHRCLDGSGRHREMKTMKSRNRGP